MVINVFQPILDYFTALGMVCTFRFLDAKDFRHFLPCCSRSKNTNLTTIQSYIETYAGPRFNIANSYGSMLATVWIAMMFGPAIPIMFPLAACTIINRYIVDRFMVAKFCR